LQQSDRLNSGFTEFIVAPKAICHSGENTFS
jgi:hypothetical protein